MVQFEKFDACGLGVALCSIVLILIGISWAPLAVYVNWDPIFLVLNKHFPGLFQNQLSSGTIFIIRYVLSQWCTLEVTRLCILIFIPLMMFGNSYLAIIFRLQNMTLDNKVIHLYNMLHCVNQTGRETIAILGGFMLSVGIIMLVAINSILISSWSLLPIVLDFLCFNLAVVIYFFIFQTLPIVIKCNDLSLNLLNEWNLSINTQKGFRLYWVKKVKAQRPLAVYYAYTKFEQSTKRNFYSTIIDYTISVVLVL